MLTKQLKFTTTSRQCLASPSKLSWWVRLRDVRVAVDCDIYIPLPTINLNTHHTKVNINTNFIWVVICPNLLRVFQNKDFLKGKDTVLTILLMRADFAFLGLEQFISAF